MEYTFDKIFNYDKLLSAHNRTKKCKMYKNEVIKFEFDKFANITQLEDRLNDGTYKILRYKKFMIYDPKEREIQALPYRDRVVQNCLCHYFLVPYYTPKLIYDNGACQKGKGTHFTRARIEHFLADYYKHYGYSGYFLRLDIKKYFNNIDHEILKQTLGRIHDEKLRKLIYLIIDSYNHTPGKGVPMGNQSSQIFALLYLNKVDRLIKEKYSMKYYVRYMDDLLVIHHDKELLQCLYAEIKQAIASLNLELNKKSEIIAIKNGLNFLGVHYNLSKTGKVIKKMKTQSKKRMLKRVKQLCQQYRARVIEYIDIKQSLAGFKGNIKRMMVNGIKLKYLIPLKKIGCE